jgi:hypothetical protein
MQLCEFCGGSISVSFHLFLANEAVSGRRRTCASQVPALEDHDRLVFSEVRSYMRSALSRVRRAAEGPSLYSAAVVGGVHTP